MHYLITGGTGLIGRALCQQLLATGHEITVLSRNKQKVIEKCGFEATAIKSLDEIHPEKKIDVVINLAGEPIADKRWSRQQKTILEKSRIDLTEELVHWIQKRQYKPDSLISGSAVGWYGDQGDKPLTETSEYQHDYAHELCDRWESAALTASDEVRVCIIRTGLVLSSRGGVLQRMLLPFKLGGGCTLGSGQQFMPWIHITDIVNLIIFISQTPSAKGIFNATAPRPVINKEFTQALASHLHRPALLKAPAWILRFILGEMSQLLLGGQRAYPEKAQATGFQFQYTELNQALNNLLNQS